MNLIWGGVYSAYKVIGPSLSAGGIVTLRFGIAAVCLLVFWPWLPGVAPRGRDLIVTCLLGLLVFGVGQRLQVYGNEVGSAGNSAVLMALEPLVASVAAAIFLKEQVGPRRVMGFSLGALGVVLLNRVWRPDFHWAGLSASVIFISSFFCETAFSVVGKPIISRSGVMKMLALSLLSGTVANVLIDGRTTFNASRSLPWEAWALLGGLAVICTAVGYTAWFLVIRECPLSVAALTIFAQSVFGVLIAAVWIGEPLHWGQVWGSVAIVLGLAVGLSRQIRPENRARSVIRAN